MGTYHNIGHGTLESAEAEIKHLNDLLKPIINRDIWLAKGEFGDLVFLFGSEPVQYDYYWKSKMGLPELAQIFGSQCFAIFGDCPKNGECIHIRGGWQKVDTK